MRRIDQLITISRKNTGNVEFTDTTGIGDDQMIEWANFGQERILSLIQREHPSILQREKVIDATTSVETVNLPDDLFLGSRVEKVEYSSTRNESDYYNLIRYTIHERFNGIQSDPVAYIRRSSQILLQPKPQSNGLVRITYQKAIPRLDVRRGQVSAVTLGATTITSLTLDATQTIDDSTLLDYGYMTVVDSDGVVKMKGIPISAINTTTGTVTVSPTFVFETGETISVGDYVVAGKYSSTHSSLPEVCERYLIQYMDFKAFKADSNTDSEEAVAELKAMEEEIIASFAEPDVDIIPIPYISSEYDNLM